MSNLKIIDDLSKEDIPLQKIISFCTNPVREADNWHTRNEMVDDDATKILNLYNVDDADYQVFALHDDGRREGAVWFPVTVTKQKYICYECKKEVQNFDNILDDVTEENIMCESCDEIVTCHLGCVIVPRSE